MFLTPLVCSLLLPASTGWNGPPAAAPAVAPSPHVAVRFVDVTGDGSPDKLIQSADGSLHIAVHQAGRKYRLVEQELPLVTVTDVLVGDLDGDGSTDLYLVSPADNVALTGDGSGYFDVDTERLGLSDAGQGLSAERLDLDGDGREDLLLHNAASDVLFWARPDGTFDRDGTLSGGGGASPASGGGAATGAGQQGGASASPSAGAGGAGGAGGPVGPPGSVTPSGTAGPTLLGPLGPTPDADVRVGGARSDEGARGPAPTPQIPSVLDGVYVNDNANEVDSADVIDYSLTGPDVSTTTGDVTFLGGDVGIGTALPTTALHVQNGSSGIGGFVNPDSLLQLESSAETWLTLAAPPTSPSGILFARGNSSADGNIRYNPDRSMNFRTGGNLERMSITANGDVGIGTTAPTAPLHVQEGSSGLGGFINSDSLLHLESSAAGWLTMSVPFGNTSGILFAQGNSGADGNIRYNGDRSMTFRTGGNLERMSITSTGDVGIGTSTPQAKLDVTGAIRSNAAVRVDTTTDGYGLNHSNGTIEAGTYVGSLGGGTGGWFGTKTNHPVNFFTNNGAQQATLRTDGTFVVRVLEITGGADIVERFETPDENLAPGTLVVIDADNPGQLTASSQAYDRKVAGIVSGAGGVNPGLCLGQDGTLEGDVKIAMNGRVYVQCSTENGAIVPGDLLTTSSLSGHAMKATDAERWDGAVIGKAMSGLDAATGLVLVLVNLQ